MERNPFQNPSHVKRWLAVYTRPRWEKKVDMLLNQQGIECYCPLRKVESQWSDRVKTVELPLFNSYVFVRVNHKEELAVRETHGVLNFIYYMGKPAVLRDSAIEEIKHYIEVCPDMEVVDIRSVSKGDRVRIKNGIFQDQEGNVINVEGKNVLMVLDNLQCAVVTRVPLLNLVPA